MTAVSHVGKFRLNPTLQWGKLVAERFQHWKFPKLGIDIPHNISELSNAGFINFFSNSESYRHLCTVFTFHRTFFCLHSQACCVMARAVRELTMKKIMNYMHICICKCSEFGVDPSKEKI